MNPQVLGRITTSMERPRGPDVQMTVAVPEEWVVSGATLEILLPRNLACAACAGGGCDACERSGAVSLRGRKDPVETVEVTLPAFEGEPGASRARIVIVRIPDRGGLPPPGLPLPRGNLLLSVRTGAEIQGSVTRLAQPSIPAPPPIEILSTGFEALRPVSASPERRMRPVVRLALGLAAALMFIAFIWWRTH